MLELKKVTSGCGKSPFLKDISVSFEKGRFTSVIGPNGSGKSTLLKTAVGIVTPDSGELFADGESLTKMKHKETARIIAYLSQGKGTPDMTVEQLVLHGRFPHLGYPRRYTENDRRAALDAMEKTGVADYADRSLSSLSGGMRQNVYIAMALAQGTDYILLDEPTTYLDIGQQLKLADSVRQLAVSGKTVLLVLHDILLALKISDRIAVMENGIISQTGTPDEILASDILRKIYGVGVKTLETPDGTEYYYERSL